MPIIPQNTPIPTQPPPFTTQIYLFFQYYTWVFISIIALVTTLIILVIIIKKVKRTSFKKEMVFKDFNTGQYSIIMFRKIGEKYVEIERKKIDVKQNKWRYENKDYKFNRKMVAYSDKKNNYFAFDFDSGEQLSFKTQGLPEKISIDELDIYINRHIIEQLVAGLEMQKGKGQYLLLVVGIVLGLAIGLIIGIYVAPKTPAPTAKILFNILRGLI